MRSTLHLNARGPLHRQVNVISCHARDHVTSRLSVSGESVKMQPRSTRAGEISAGAESDEHRTPLAEREQGLLSHHLRKWRIRNGLRRNASEGEIREGSAHAHGNHSLFRFRKRVHACEQIGARGAGRNRA